MRLIGVAGGLGRFGKAAAVSHEGGSATKLEPLCETRGRYAKDAQAQYSETPLGNMKCGGPVRRSPDKLARFKTLDMRNEPPLWVALAAMRLLRRLIDRFIRAQANPFQRCSREHHSGIPPKQRGQRTTQCATRLDIPGSYPPPDRTKPVGRHRADKDRVGIKHQSFGQFHLDLAIKADAHLQREMPMRRIAAHDPLDPCNGVADPERAAPCPATAIGVRDRNAGMRQGRHNLT